MVYILEAINVREMTEGPTTLGTVKEEDEVDFDSIDIY